MARFLFVVPPLHGHVNPTVAAGDALTRAGHQVAWCGYSPFLVDVVPDPGAVLRVGDEVPGALGDVQRRAAGLRGAAALKFFFEEFLVPLADAMVPGVEKAVDSFGPDVVVVDQQTVPVRWWRAGGACRGRPVPPRRPSSSTRSPSCRGCASGPTACWWRCKWRTATPPPRRPARPCASRRTWSWPSPPRHCSGTPVAGRRWPEHWAFVGPAVAGRGPTMGALDWPWEPSDPRPAVLVSLGTVNAETGGRFFAVAADAFAGSGVRAMIVAPPAMVADPPENVVVRARVPQLLVLDRVDAVVCHAGHNTVAEALAVGLPLVVAPIRDDQPVVAQQVVDRSAGIRVRYGRVRPADLRQAVEAVLSEPAYRQAAQRIQSSFAAAGGAVAAAARLQALAGEPVGPGVGSGAGAAGGNGEHAARQAVPQASGLGT